MPNVARYNTLDIALRSPESPAIIVPVCEPLGQTDMARLRANADAAELRIDQFLPCGDRIIYAEIARLGGLPILATVRLRAEGGDWIGASRERVELFQSILPQVHGIDVELQAADVPELVERADGKVVVASMHDFDTTPDHLVLEARLERALRLRADYFKVATTVNNDAELAQIIGFMERNPTEPIIAVTMGRLGVLGRLELLARGSRATYAYVGDNPVATGQLSLDEMLQLKQLEQGS